MDLRAAVPGLVGAASAALAGVGAAPTGVPVADLAWCALLGAVVGTAASRLGPTAWLLSVAVLTAAAWGDAIAVVAVGVLTVAAMASVVDRSPRLAAGVAAGAALPTILLRLSWPTPTGATAILAAAVTVAVCVAAAARSSRRVPVLHALLGLIVVVQLLTASSLLTVVAQRPHLERAVDVVEAGLDASRRGDAAESARMLAEAAADLEWTRERLDRPHARTGRAVPILSQQLRAVDELVRSAADLARTGARAAAAADTDRLRPSGGRVDLAAIDALVTPIEDVRDAIRRARRRFDAARSPWIVAPLANAGDELFDRTRDAEADALRALRALAVIPDLLGRAGERRWLLLVTTPAELRGSGGFPGNYGVIRTDRGAVELELLGRIGEVSAAGLAAATPVFGTPEYLSRYRDIYGLDRYFQNSTASPHFPNVASAMADRYAAITGTAIDGAISVDPDAFAALLGLVGPVTVAGWDEPITAANARRVLLHEQYFRTDTDSAERAEFLDDVARLVFDRVVGGGLPGPADVSSALSGLLPQRHIQLWSRNADEQAWFALVGATAGLAPLRGDALAVIVNDSSNSKIDWYLHRSIDYRVRRDGAGGAAAELVVRLRNDAPSEGPAYVIGGGVAPAGYNEMLVSVFTPMEATSITIDGEPADVFPPSTEQGRNVVELFVSAPPGATVEVRIGLAGRLARGDYRLDLHHQPVINPDQVLVAVDGETIFDGEQDRDLVLVAP